MNPKRLSNLHKELQDFSRRGSTSLPFENLDNIRFHRSRYGSSSDITELSSNRVYSVENEGSMFEDSINPTCRNTNVPKSKTLARKYNPITSNPGLHRANAFHARDKTTSTNTSHHLSNIGSIAKKNATSEVAMGMPNANIAHPPTDDFVPFEVDDEGRVIPKRSYRTNHLEGEKLHKSKFSKGKSKIKRRILPFMYKLSENLNSAVSEMDLTKLADFSLVMDDERSGSASDEESSYSPFKENNLRQAESLDNVFDQAWNEEKDICGEEGENRSSVSNAKSLPHINQLSDYEDEVDHNNQQPSNNKTPPNRNFVSSNDAGLTPKISQTKRIHKKKKTNLKRRHATREKDGRSKSLTQIDNLVDPSNDMLLLGSQGGDGSRDGNKSGAQSTHHNKLGIPDEHSGRRPPLSMENRISSGEFITIMTDSTREPLEECLLASRGVSLRDLLETRGIDVVGIDVFQDGHKSPIPLHTDASQLGGRCIYVKAKDDAKSPVRNRSTSHIPRKPSGGRFWGGTSTEDYTQLVDEKTNGSQGYQDGSFKGPKSNKPNNRWSLFQSNSKDSKMEDLVRQLDFYSRSGIPKLPHLLPCQSIGDDNELKLEDGWRSIVSCLSSMSEREEQRQSAIWELVETEATYISMLKVITDLFLACLCNLQNEGILNEIDTEKLFNNIQDVYLSSLHFWRNYITPVLEETRKTKQPLDSTILLEGFCKFEEIFHPYTQYCLEQTNCQLYCKEHARENNYFKAYLAWCETQKECNRLKLVDILVQPMQRITRYSILLKAILRKTDEEEHKSCLQEMILHVDRFVTTVNTALRNRHEQERLREITNRIDSYDAVEARDDELAAAIRSYSDLNLLQPMPGCPPSISRWLLYQGDFRLKDAHTSKTDVHIFLFTDFLLLTKVTQRKAEKVKIVRPPYRIDHLIVVDLKDSSTVGLIHVTDWGVAAAAFTLQSGDSKIMKGLLDSLNHAKKQFQDAKQARVRPSYDPEEEVSHPLPRSPRIGSSRASRVSSLAHSHSGSMDLNEASSYASPGGHHPPSVDATDVRASSASSEDSFSNHQAEIYRSKSLEGQHSVNTKQDRRLAFPKTPNTLSVTPPYTTGQSLPNLSEPTNSLRVPTHKQLSPSNRGTSYPPPSPRTLRRCPPVPQSRNPPLIKTKHVTSVMGHPQEITAAEPECPKLESDQDEQSRRRLSRVDRLDNRRYHTAGAIDDIKKQDTKDTSIHKRLSWNYGQGPPPPPKESEETPRPLSSQKSTSKSISCESVHSSSGVSSTSSLLRSEYEALENIDDNEVGDEDSTVVDLSVSDCTSLKISPHISTTYICHDSDVTLGVTTSQYITQPLEEFHGPSEKSTAGVKIDLPVSESELTTAKDGASNVASVQITVNETIGATGASTTMPHSPLPPSSLLLRSCSSSSSSSSSSSLSSSSSSLASGPRPSPKNLPHKTEEMREILLNDASVEASDV